MFDFPSSPTQGQQVGHGDIIYTWDGAKWTFGPHGVSAFLPLTGGTMTGALVLYGPPQQPLEAATKAYTDTKLPLGGGTLTGPLLLSQDPTSNMMAATRQYVDSRSGVTSFNNRTGAVALTQGDVTSLGFYTSAQDDARFVHKAGDTMTGTLTVSNGRIVSTSAGNVMQSLVVWSQQNGWAAGLFMGGAGDRNLYVANANGDGSYASPVYARFDQSGNFFASGAVTGSYVHSTGTVQADGNLGVSGDSIQHNIYVDGGLGLNFRGVYNSGVWYAFGWDGTYLNYAINGGGQGGLITWQQGDGRYPTWGATWDFWDCTVGGTLYAQNGNATHQFSNINVGGNAVCGYIKSNGWTDTQNLHVFTNNATFDGEIHVAAAAFSSWIVTTAVDTNVWGFYMSWPHVYSRYAGQYDAWLGDYSTEKGKQDIAPSRIDCLELVKRLPINEFRYKRLDPRTNQLVPAEEDDDLIPIGLIAERIGELLPEALVGRNAKAPDGGMMMHNVNTNMLLAVLIGAVQQLARQADGR